MWINQEFVDGVSRNCYWDGKLSEDKKTVTVRFGRIGVEGKPSVKTLDNEWEARDFLNKKVREKEGKGYRKVPDEVWARMQQVAKVIGTKGKMKELRFFDLAGDRLREVKPEALMDPSIIPGVLVICELKVEKDMRSLTLLFADRDYVSLTGFCTRLSDYKVIDESHYLYETVQKAKEAAGVYLGE